MLDMLSIAVSICYMILWYCISLVCRRLEEVDGLRHPKVILNQWRLYRRYWQLAPDHNWSRIPVVLACTVILCGLISAGGVAALLISQKLK